jgi:hypothetical protein
VKGVGLFKTRHKELISIDVNERSITHHLANCFAELLPQYDVDCEYNRMSGDLPKRIHWSGEPAKRNDIEAKTVFPDIIAHKRGHNDSNLLVIEVKKSNANTIEREKDQNKIEAYCEDLNYTYGLYLVIQEDSLYEWFIDRKWLLPTCHSRESGNPLSDPVEIINSH